MPFDVDSRLGPYHLLALLGAGATGRVYRARDDRLGRDVAIKIIPLDGALTSERRFEQESRAVSALNHPNILTVHDVGTADGAGYLVTEYVEGESLRAVLNRGALTLTTVLDIGIQIAEGLQAAHEATLVHRDLKPENVMVTPEGRVKILDFGLAKPFLTNPETDTGVTLGVNETAPGLLIGTTAYMSPEQARGGNVTPYSDQFSLGVMLYEMCTGVSIFRRPTALETLSAVLSDPAPELNVGPVPFRWLVMRCLHKQPDHRYAVTADIARELRNIRERIATEPRAEVPLSPAAASVEPQTSPETEDETGHRVPTARLLHMLILLAAAAVGFAAGRLTGIDSRVPQLISEATPVTAPGELASSPALSDDGRLLAYALGANGSDGTPQIFVESVDGGTPRQITRDPAGCAQPQWAGANARVWAVCGNALYAVSAAGGAAARVVADAAHFAVSADETSVSVLQPDGSGTFSLATGTPGSTLRIVRAGLLPETYLAYRPGTKSFWVWAALSSGASEIWEISPGSAGPKRVGASIALASRPFSADARGIVFSDAGHVVRADLDSGELIPVTAGAGNEVSPSVSSGRGTVAVVSENLSGNGSDNASPAPAASPAFRTALPGSALIHAAVHSPDRGRIALVARTAAGESLWLAASQPGSSVIELTRPADGIVRNVQWSADGSTIQWQTLRAGKWLGQQIRPAQPAARPTASGVQVAPIQPAPLPHGRVWLLHTR